MHRRRFVAAASLGLAGFGGCITDHTTPDSGPAETVDGADPATSTAGDTGEASTPTMNAPFPPERDDVDEVVWHRQISNPESVLLLEPSTTTASLPRAELSVTLHNGTDRAFQTNFYGWGIYRWESGRWHYVAPTTVPQPLTPLPAGEDHRFTLTVDNGDRSGPSLHVQGTSDLSLGALGGGTYAFGIEGWWPDQSATPTHEHQTMRAARFVLEGDPLALEPSSAVTDVRRDGDTVTVAATNEAAAETGEDRPATFVLTADESVTDPRPLVTEQAYREWPLRDALAYAEPDVTEVRVETTTTGHPPFGVDEATPPVAYDGRSYRLRAETGAT